MNGPARIGSPDDPALPPLCQWLRERSGELDQPPAWPAAQLAQCGAAGVYEWFVGTNCGGQGWAAADICRGYMALSRACLTTTFVITQAMGACQRIAAADNDRFRQEWLPELIGGRRFATIGISHLTTSRRHLASPVLSAQRRGDLWLLDGYSPWVTGAVHADILVVGAALDDEQQVLLAVPRHWPGVQVPSPQRLLGLSASCTGVVEFQQVELPDCWRLAGPEREVMKRGTGGTTGGLQTSSLALGLAAAALDFLEREAGPRPDLQEAAQVLRGEWQRLSGDLLAAAAGVGMCSTEQLRTRANSLVLRGTQAALVAAKGTGYVAGHPAGRWCQEALFFLVWSCPQNVLAANLCEFAGRGA